MVFEGKILKSGPARGLSRNVIILGFVSLLNDAASEMIYPLPVFLTAVLSAGPAVVGVIEGVAESTASLLKLYSGYVSDRVKKRKGWVIAGYAISNIIRPLIAFAASWSQVLVLRFSDRVGKGLRTSPRDAMIADSPRRAGAHSVSTAPWTMEARSSARCLPPGFFC
jgi:hypothetical protein